MKLIYLNQTINGAEITFEKADGSTVEVAVRALDSGKLIVEAFGRDDYQLEFSLEDDCLTAVVCHCPGCDRCGTNDRAVGSNICTKCKEETQ